MEEHARLFKAGSLLGKLLLFRCFYWDREKLFQMPVFQLLTGFRRCWLINISQCEAVLLVLCANTWEKKICWCKAKIQTEPFCYWIVCLAFFKYSAFVCQMNLRGMLKSVTLGHKTPAPLFNRRVQHPPSRSVWRFLPGVGTPSRSLLEAEERHLVTGMSEWHQSLLNDYFSTLMSWLQ